MGKYHLKDRGAKPGLFYVLALSKRPGLLLEVGFISNESELRKIISPKFQKVYAKSIVDGINSYLLTLERPGPALF